MSERHSAWDGLLDEDETILWQGAPDGKFRYELEHPISIVIGLAFVAISTPNLPTLFAERTPMIIFPLIFLGIGIYSLIGKNFYETWCRRGTFYTLTTKRAFIGSRDYKGKTLDSYVISDKNRIRLKKTTPPSVYFAQETIRRRTSTKTVDIGFRFIDDAKTVMGHLRALQGRETT